ncbi:hypothetical protein PAP_06160 [Palaeococcus pacificus DY20341]|uniref:Uncharacterized protein n=1 Tax=Palaeococcus pacificus DY20341 TaxID=1343739 RepID=A0A075LUH7_9EURY|nr:hypothetical protein PAP_06160 [Palaeococcus pacificus DY20341]
MAKVSKVATENSGSHSSQNASKRRKTRIHIAIDEEVGEVLEKASFNKSKLINMPLRCLFFGSVRT